jgi:hypothetical protein
MDLLPVFHLSDICGRALPLGTVILNITILTKARVTESGIIFSILAGAIPGQKRLIEASQGEYLSESEHLGLADDMPVISSVAQHRTESEDADPTFARFQRGCWFLLVLAGTWEALGGWESNR